MAAGGRPKAAASCMAARPVSTSATANRPPRASSRARHKHNARALTLTAHDAEGEGERAAPLRGQRHRLRVNGAVPHLRQAGRQAARGRAPGGQAAWRCNGRWQRAHRGAH